MTVNTFITEFAYFLESTIILSAEPLVIVGDFNIHFDDANDPGAAIFLDLLESMNLKQLVTGPTHERGHTLDLTITRETDSVVHGIPSIGRFFSDHAVVTCRLNSMKPPVPMKTVTYRKLKAVDIGELRRDLINSRLADRTPVDLDDLVHAYDDTLASLTERYAPLSTRTFTNRPHMPWFNDDIKAAIRERRRAEHKWKRSGVHEDFVAFKRAKNYALLALNQARLCYLSDFIMDNSDNQAKLFRATKSLLSQPRSCTVPPGSDVVCLANEVGDFFASKVSRMHAALDGNSGAVDDDGLEDGNCSVSFEKFNILSPEDVRGLICRAAKKSCPLDPMPTTLATKCLDELTPVLTDMINTSLQSGHFAEKWKEALVTPLLKKAGLDQTKANLRPVSNLAYVSKLTESAAVTQLEKHMLENGLYPLHQSSYRNHHSTVKRA